MRDRVRLIPGDCIRAMRIMAALGIQVDSIVTDPPYHLTSIIKRFGANGAAPAKDRDGLYRRASAGFMGKTWDGGDVAFRVETWELAMAVLKPGGHLLAFGGTRGWHRMACAIEDAGFEIRDTVAWLYGSGFPKSHDVSKGINKAAGAEREVTRERYTTKRIKPGATVVAEGKWGKQDVSYTATDSAPATPEAAQWNGWGTALKPAFEPIVLARKPLGEKSVAANVLAHGTGAINVDGCRIEGPDNPAKGETPRGGIWTTDPDAKTELTENTNGRWPANVCHDGSEEVEAAFAAFGDRAAGGVVKGHEPSRTGNNGIYGEWGRVANKPHSDSGTAARFFYSAKAGPEDRFGSKHPTVKPVSLMRWLARLVTPPGGLILDPFAGSGSTGVAAIAEGFRAILIEADPEHQADIREHLAWVTGEGRHALAAKARNAPKEKTGHGDLPLFANPDAAE